MQTIKADDRLTIWRIANEARREAGQNELLLADFRAFLGEMLQAAVEFDAVYSDAMFARNAVEEAQKKIAAL